MEKKIALARLARALVVNAPNLMLASSFSSAPHRALGGCRQISGSIKTCYRSYLSVRSFSTWKRSSKCFVDSPQSPQRLIHLVDEAAASSAGITDDTNASNTPSLAHTSISAAAFARECGFRGRLGEMLPLPSESGPGVGDYLFGTGDGTVPMDIGLAPTKLQPGVYGLADSSTRRDPSELALAWALGAYRFNDYKQKKESKVSDNPPQLVWPAGADSARVLAQADGVYLARDLINTPANLLGPLELEQSFRELGALHSADVRVISGRALEADFPLIHAVGKGSEREPRLLDMRWGRKGARRVTLIGKGVVFDTGGLDIKPPASMLTMKKDMGGAAAVMGLAHALMATQTDVELRVLVPAVENSVSGGAFRPSDVLRSRAGLSVEVGNTDAEGRLILADALSLADEEPPELLVDMATLTGAHRVALGEEIAGVLTNSDDVYSQLYQAGEVAGDYVWRLPLHPGYESMLHSPIADTNNIGSKPLAGAITAALFLQKFCPATIEAGGAWVHVDFSGWTEARPGRPKGGEPHGALALFQVIQDMAVVQ